MSATSPEFVRVTDCAALVVPMVCCAKVRAVGVRVSVAGALPVPESAAVWVPAESVSESVAERAPLAMGLKVMESVQPVEAPRLFPQVLAEMAKSDGLAPIITGVWSVAEVPPRLATTTFCTDDVWLMMVAGKVTEVGVKVIDAAAVPVPVRETRAWPPEMLA